MMCSNKMIVVYARNKLKKNNLVLLKSSEKHIVNHMQGGSHRKSGVSKISHLLSNGTHGVSVAF